MKCITIVIPKQVMLPILENSKDKVEQGMLRGLNMDTVINTEWGILERQGNNKDMVAKCKEDKNLLRNCCS